MPLRYTLAALFLFAPSVVHAQTPGSCALGQARAELSLSDVRAALYNKGNLFWNGLDGEYEVPRGEGIRPIFAAGLWAGGTVGGEVRTAAATYTQGNTDWEFWPGPLDAGADLPSPGDCSVYDRIYRVTAPELAAYEAGRPAIASLRGWPVGLGAPAVDASGAPVVPTSRTQTVDLDAGERPVVYGSETAFWVMNDVGNEHLTTGSAPLGIEVRTTAFSINDPAVSVLDQSTFYRYEVINRSAATIEDFRLGFWIDPDLGNFSDDYVGSDPERSMFYAYNADNEDEGNTGYGTPPPALGIDILTGGYGALSYVSSGPTSEPNTRDDHYAYLRATWKDGTPMTRLGDGYNPGSGGEAVLWQYGGDPTAGDAFWSEVDTSPASGNQPNAPNDRRGVVSALPVDLAPGATHTMDVAVVFARGADNLDSVTELRAASDLIQARYDDGSLFATTSGDLGLPPATAPALLAPADGVTVEPPAAVVLDWEPVADADRYRVEYGGDPALVTFQSAEALAPPYSVDLETLPQGDFDPVYWRVTSLNGAGAGPSSETRSFVYGFEYAAGVQLLSNGQEAFLEVAAPGGADPCGPAAGSTFGCAEAGGNAVFGGSRGDTADANATGQYGVFSLGSFELGLVSGAPREVEIRFTPAGSIGIYAFGDNPGGAPTIRVPFEVWDVGVVALGQDGVPAANDPADDVRLIPALFADDAGNGRGECAFEFGEVPAVATTDNPSGLALTDRIWAYRSHAGQDYAAFEALAAPLVDAAPDGCYRDADGAVAAFIPPLNENRALERIVFADLTGSGSVADLQGAVVRFHTTNPEPVAGDAAPEPSALALTVFPNPSRGAARVRFEMPLAGAARVRVLDVLGRQVAVLADGARSQGAHELALPRGLAPGVYVVMVAADDAHAVRTVTIVR